MSDPAVEAARRIFERTKTITFSPDGPWARDALIPAAREALVPIRELHVPISTTDPDGYGDYLRCSCGFPNWSDCRTAMAVYTSEELDRG